MEQRIYLSPPHMNGYEMGYIQDAFDKNWIAPLGENVDAFERSLCDYVGLKFGLALSSGTAGIHLALNYFGVGPGDYVFCSSLTFAGSCNPIMYQYATPVFIDSEYETWNMSPQALRDAFEWAKRQGTMPKVVIIVDLYGQSADYDALLPICKAYDVPVIEDAAEALGASYMGRKCGTFGDINIFSFNGNKIITTSGGGMVLSDNEEAMKKMRFLSTQAREPARHYEHKEIGYNYRMSNICAGIGRGQLITLDDRVQTRKAIFHRYKEGFKDLPLELMPISSKGQPNYWLTVITINDPSITPEDIILALESENIESRPLWKPMHMQPVFKGYPFFSHLQEGSVGHELFSRSVCLPSGSSLTEAQQSRVIETVKSVF